MAAEGSIHVEGLSELIAAFNRVDKGLGAELTAGLRDISTTVAGAARSTAYGEGLEDGRPPPGGGLVDSIKPVSAAKYAAVRVTAKRPSPAYPAGYHYPRRLEYGGHPFLRPAIRQTSGYVRGRLEAMLEWVATTWRA